MRARKHPLECADARGRRAGPNDRPRVQIRRPVQIALGPRFDSRKKSLAFRSARSESAGGWERFLEIRGGRVSDSLETRKGAEKSC